MEFALLQAQENWLKSLCSSWLLSPGKIFFLNQLLEAAYTSDLFIFIAILNIPAQRKLLHFDPRTAAWVGIPWAGAAKFSLLEKAGQPQ